MSSDHQRILSSKSVEWYTPPEYVDAARLVLEGIDLDPASNPIANTWIKASSFFTEADNGLTKNWWGRVWLNPPYGRGPGNVSNQKLWSRKLIREYNAGKVAAAILLVNAATGDDWFTPLWQYAICFTRRIKFVSPEGKRKSPTHGNAFVYLGPNPEGFKRVFGHLGHVVPEGVAYSARR